MASDIVEKALSQPIDWEVFENLVHAVLVADDFPSLVKMGGRSDQGADGINEAFYDGKRKLETVVQITSDQAQRNKVKNTIAKLRKHGHTPRTLVVVTRQPIASEVRREIVSAAEDEGVNVELRDSSYLSAQLSKPDSRIFARFFGSGAEQVSALLATDDPLQALDGRLLHALLATLGAFVTSPHARLARATLFDKTVLAALAANEGRSTKTKLAESVQSLLQREQIDESRIQAAIDRLGTEGSCRVEGDEVVCSDDVLSALAAVLKSAQVGLDELLAHVSANCERAGKVSDAQRGFIERNVKRATFQLLRLAGPSLELSLSGLAEDDVSDAVHKIMSNDLPPALGQAALSAFAEFAANPASAAKLAPLTRSYAALAIRNADPIGRQWQKNVLARTCIALDTDAILSVLVVDLPEHRAVLNALKGLSEAGVELLLPEHVLDEAVAHIGRANRTFFRFATQLTQLPSATVDSRVWHAVVRGYYYAFKAGKATSPEKYLSRYLNKAEPRRYVEHILSRRLKLTIAPLDQAPPGTDEVLNELEIDSLKGRERNRLKAGFRDENEMAARVRADVAMALNVSIRSGPQAGADAKGYVLTSDRAFRRMQHHVAWQGRDPIVIATRSVPEFASFVCGTPLDDDQAVALLFHPVQVAAAEQLSPQIMALAAIGVDLKERPLDQLDWDIRHGLRESLEGLEEAVVGSSDSSSQAAGPAALKTAQAAADAGYILTPVIKELVESYGKLVEREASALTREAELEAKVRAFVSAALETTDKGRRRIRRLLKDLGLEFEQRDSRGTGE